MSFWQMATGILLFIVVLGAAWALEFAYSVKRGEIR